MAERQYRTLTKRTVDRLSVNGKDAVFWDNELPGFGVRVYPSGKKVFVVQTRAFGRSKRVRLGTHGDIAAAHGFWNPSRFAQLYRRQFGELPSETRVSGVTRPLRHRTGRRHQG